MSGSTGPETPSRRPPSLRALGVSIALLLLAAVASAASSTFIGLRFPDRPTPRDLLFESLPYVSEAEYVTDFALLAALALLVAYAVRHARHEIPDMISVFALMYLLRSVVMALTPLASANGNGAVFGLVPMVQNGMFPSGHGGAATLCYLLVDAERAPVLKRTMLVLAFVEWIALLLARGHYSIDIVGGMLLAYFVHREWTRGETLFRPLERLVYGSGASH